MKKIILFFVMLLFYSLARGQTSSKVNDCNWFGNVYIPSEYYLNSQEYLSSLDSINFDTLSIVELVDFRRELDQLKGLDDVSSDFIFSKDRQLSNEDMLYGIYWPNGEVLALPYKAVSGTVRLKKDNGKTILTWFQKEPIDESYSLYFYTLPLDIVIIEDKHVSIRPALKRVLKKD